MPPTRADYAKINIACKELGLDRKQLISDRYGIESSKQLNKRQLADLYTYFRSQGWKVKRAKISKLSPKYNDAIHRKIVALWITLHKAGVIRNGSDLALQAYVKRMTGIENLRWCYTLQDCNLLVESLKAWGVREGVDVD